MLKEKWIDERSKKKKKKIKGKDSEKKYRQESVNGEEEHRRVGSEMGGAKGKRYKRRIDRGKCT